MSQNKRENTVQTKRTIKVTHFREKCIGCGICAAMAPEDWMIDTDGLATLKKSIKKKEIYTGEVEQQNYEQNKDAAESCPMNIIKLS